MYFNIFFYFFAGFKRASSETLDYSPNIRQRLTGYQSSSAESFYFDALDEEGETNVGGEEEMESDEAAEDLQKEEKDDPTFCPNSLRRSKRKNKGCRKSRS